jgi:hypothetical protein
MTTFQLLAIPASIAFALISGLRGRSRGNPRQNLFWLFLWLSAALVIALPQLASSVAHALGIGRGADLVLYALTFASILSARYFYVKHRILEIQLTEIIRQSAIASARRGALLESSSQAPGERGSKAH